MARWRPEGPPLSEQDRLIDELLQRLRPEALDQCENEKVFTVHEKISCPATVRDAEHFTDIVCVYYDAYHGGAHARSRKERRARGEVPLYGEAQAELTFRSMARTFFSRHLAGYPVPYRPTPQWVVALRESVIPFPDPSWQAMSAAERNAISGAEGGMIGVVAHYQRGLLSSVVENKVSSEFHEVIPYAHFPDRIWVVARIMERFSDLLGNQHAWDVLDWMFHEEDFLCRFVLHLRALHNALQR